MPAFKSGSWLDLQDTKPAGNRQDTSVSNEASTRASIAHGKNFKLDLKGEHKIQLARNKPRDSAPVFKEWCASGVIQSAVSKNTGNGDP